MSRNETSNLSIDRSWMGLRILSWTVRALFQLVFHGSLKGNDFPFITPPLLTATFRRAVPSVPALVFPHSVCQVPLVPTQRLAAAHAAAVSALVRHHSGPGQVPRSKER